MTGTDSHSIQENLSNLTLQFPGSSLGLTGKNNLLLKFYITRGFVTVS